MINFGGGMSYFVAINFSAVLVTLSYRIKIWIHFMDLCNSLRISYLYEIVWKTTFKCLIILNLNLKYTRGYKYFFSKIFSLCVWIYWNHFLCFWNEMLKILWENIKWLGFTKNILIRNFDKLSNELLLTNKSIKHESIYHFIKIKF